MNKINLTVSIVKFFTCVIGIRELCTIHYHIPDAIYTKHGIPAEESLIN